MNLKSDWRLGCLGSVSREGGDLVTWLWLSVLSATLLGFYDINKKLALSNNPVLPVLVLSTASGWIGLCAAVFLLPEHYRSEWQLALTPLSAADHLSVLLKAALVSVYWLLSFLAIQRLPLSIAAPLRCSSPVFTLLGAVLLYSEAPSPSQWLGIGLVLFGAIGFAVLGSWEGKGTAAPRWLALLFASTLLAASSGLYDKFLLHRRHLPPTSLQFWFTTYNLALQALMAAVLWWPRREKGRPTRSTASIVAVGVLLTAGDQLYFRALAQPEALISVVSLIRRCSVLLSFAAGGLILKERWMGRKSLPLVFMLAGLVVLLYR